MASVDVPPERARRRPVPALGVALALGVLVALAGPGWATAAGPEASPAAVVTEPGTDPGGETPSAEPTGPSPDPTTPPPTIDPPEETTPPPPTTTPPPPATTAPETPPPTTTVPTPATSRSTRPWTPPPPRPPASSAAPAPTPLGVRITTGDVRLGPGYWNAASTVTTLRVTVTNTGRTTERIRLSYRLPAGLTDAGTAGCAASGDRAYRCGEWTADAGDRFSTLVRVRVAGSAWQRMPLSGSVTVTASAPGVSGTARDNEGFAVLFPPGPPVPGITLQADEVAFDISGGASDLAVRLANTGTVDAAGRIDVVLPAGVSVPVLPAGCATVDPGRTRCDLGTVAAGRRADLRLPVEATPEAQRDAPLAGAVVGRLDPRNGRTRQVQMSFRITAAAALATPVAAGPLPTGSQGVLAADDVLPDSAGGGSGRRTVMILIAASALLVVLALGLATTSLRRRLTEPLAEPPAAPGGDLRIGRADAGPDIGRR